MKDDLTLVVMAAGMGSRFGGLKQIEPIGPNGEFLIDYSIYDAILCGFKKIVFVIKKENYDIFKDTIGKRCEGKIEVCYAFQSLDDLPEGYTIPSERVKPLGTAQAIYAARNLVDGNFVVINSDDFYGREAFRDVCKFFREQAKSSKRLFCNVCYQVANTMSLNGSVKRGVIVENDGYLSDLIESKIEYVDGKIMATPLLGGDSFEISSDTLVSTNFLGFTKDIFDYIEKKFPIFLDENQDNLLDCEFLIPSVMANAIADGFASVLVVPTKAVWHGVTYREDKEDVVLAINDLILKGVYPKDLWK